jgi:putative ABC transport system permease protein
MSGLGGLALRSLWSRRGTALLVVLSIAVSVALLAAVQTLRHDARESFTRTITGTDLVVGPRTGPLNLLLYAVFQVGDGLTSVSSASYALVTRHPDVAWTIPLSLGDSHRGFRVLGSSDALFAHYRYGADRALRAATGSLRLGRDGAVLGAAVAASLGYAVGQPLTIAHGLGDVSFAQHRGHPFTVTGILAPTGTPLDRLLIIDVEALAVIHGGGGDLHDHHEDGASHAHEHAHGGERAVAPAHDDEAHGLTAFLVGMQSRDRTLVMQRALNDYDGEALTAVIPGVALEQLWRLVGVADTALALVAVLVVVAGLIGLLTMLLASLNERRREMAILRAVGARPAQVFALLALEAALIAAAGAILGLVAARATLLAAAPWVAERFGIFVAPTLLGLPALSVVGGVALAGLAVGAIPAWRAYRNSLADGLTQRH